MSLLPYMSLCRPRSGRYQEGVTMNTEVSKYYLHPSPKQADPQWPLMPSVGGPLPIYTDKTPFVKAIGGEGELVAWMAIHRQPRSMVS